MALGSSFGFQRSLESSLDEHLPGSQGSLRTERRVQLPSMPIPGLSVVLLTIRVEHAKSGTSRQVPISPRLRGVVAMNDKDPKGYERKPTAFVFGDVVGAQIKAPKKSWLACCKAAGVVGLHFHDLRHEAGSRMLEAGWPLSHVQQILGHADASTTSRYLNASTEQVLDSMQRFGIQPLHRVAQETDPEPPPPVQAIRSLTLSCR